MSWLGRLFCCHRTMILKTTGPALVSPRGATFFVVFPGVEVKCSRCGEFWHVELNASEAMKAGLGG